MIESDDLINRFREDLRRILMTENQALKGRIAAARNQFSETMTQLEGEVAVTSAPFREQLEQQILNTLDPLISGSAQANQQRAALSEQITNLAQELSRREEEINRLRQENSQLRAQKDGLDGELATRDVQIGRLNQERDQLEQRIAAVVEEYAQAKATAARTTRAMLQRIIAALDRIEGKKSQVDILTSFLEEASQFAPRVALFVAKGDMLSGWKAFGFSSAGFNDLDVKVVHFSVNNDTMLADAYHSRRAISGGRASHRENALILDRLGSPVKDAFVAIPLVLRDRSTAVLYADGGSEGEATFDGEALELLVRLVALMVELYSFRARTIPTHRAGVSVAEPPREAATTSAPSVPSPTFSRSGPAPSEFIPEPEPPRPSGGMEGAYGGSPVATITEPSREASGGEQEVKLHNDAKRFARLLVSEIKLYNEQKVIAGRRNKDIYDRLKEDIDRSREMYSKRVSPKVRERVDYFYEELVRTLGENDPDALGSDCPGPMIGSAVE
ncbi:MAG: hypothetical protein PHX83_16075 [Acidobacteriia bacterium]|nr:hypothetical protein [Terriglobia bacterium]